MRDRDASRKLARRLLEQIAACVDDDRLTAEDRSFWEHVAAQLTRLGSVRGRKYQVYDEDVALELDSEDSEDGDAPVAELSSALASYCCSEIERALRDGDMTAEEHVFWNEMALDLSSHCYEPGASTRAVAREAVREAFEDIDRAVIALAVAVAARPMERAAAAAVAKMLTRKLHTIELRQPRGGSIVFGGRGRDAVADLRKWYAEYSRGDDCIVRQYIGPGSRGYVTYK
jgi:hypothetical protein